jgi:tRNA1Val (adenine37-N6)-methyltransferase
MPNPYFQFKQFTVYHDRCAMKVTTDSCLFGAWCAFEIQKIKPRAHTLLDIGTGTGLLSLLIAQKNDLQIEAVEIDPDATLQAKENIASSPWKQKIQIYNSDILSFHPENKFDCIISNPPFYEKELVSQHHKRNLAHHSTQLNFSELFYVTGQKLHDNGLFFLLLPFKRGREIETLLNQNHLYIIKKVEVKQSLLHAPFRIMLMGSKQKPKEVCASTISIRDKEQQYTQEFIDLLKDYYLYL